VVALALRQAMLGELLRSTRRTGSAEGLFKQAIDGLEGLAADYPGVPSYKKHLARLYDVLSTLYCATDRFPESVELAPRSWASWNTPGVARYRNGDWEAARETLMSSLEKSSGGQRI